MSYLTALKNTPEAVSVADDFFSGTVAPEIGAVPSATYTVAIEDGKLTASKTGTPGFQIQYRIIEGEHTGRKVWQTLWLTPAAQPYTLRDLQKFGIKSKADLEKGLPEGWTARIRVVLRLND